MATEQERIIQGLQYAMNMETDGKEFYLRASRESSNQMGKELLKELAAAEDIHKQTFSGIYEAIRAQKAWPVLGIPQDKANKLKTIFAQASATGSPATKGTKSELEAVKIALALEIKSQSAYNSQGKTAASDAEKEFYRKLSAEEHQHQLILEDYYQYLSDPAQWFSLKEHSSLDGG